MSGEALMPFSEGGLDREGVEEEKGQQQQPLGSKLSEEKNGGSGGKK